MRIALLVLVSLLAAAHAQAQGTQSKLQVSAQVVVSCKLDASVPRADAANRGSGAASFSVACTRGAKTSVVECTANCPAPAPRDDKLRTESQVTESAGGGPTIATLLF